jgi:AraC-like DNA-binding protein
VFPVVTEFSSVSGSPDYGSLFDRIDRFAFVPGGVQRLRVEKLPLGRDVTVALVQSTGHDILLSEPGKATFILPLAGRLGFRSRRSETGDGPGAVAWAGPGTRETMVRAGERAPYRAAVVVAPSQAPDRANSSRDEAQLFQDPDAPPAVGAIAEYCRYLVTAWSVPGTPLARPGALQASAALLLDLFAAMEEARGVEGASASAGGSRVRAAEQIMRARGDEPLAISEIAEELGVGVRSLQLAFLEHRGLSPRAVLTGIRLERAREALLSAKPDRSVTDVALACGFSHLGRFAAAYRARFGEAPRETLARRRH